MTMNVLTYILRPIEDNFLKGAIVPPLIKDGSGVTAIEYGLIAALIAVAAVVVMGTVGTNLSSTFNTVANNL
jgi:pilus assembly protein Flp/PilA